MKYLVVGGGSIGLNICRQLIEYGHSVDLISESLVSTSYKYANGISKKIPFNINNIPIIRTNNYLWLLFCCILTFFNKHNNKIYLYNESIKILEKFNIFYKEYTNTYFVNQKDIIQKIILYLSTNNNFTYYKKKVNIEDIYKLSSFYDNIFVCVGSKSNETFYNKNFNGYKIIIQSKIIPKTLLFENGFFLKSENKKLVLYGGFVNKKTKYSYIINKVKKLPLWNKYKCVHICDISEGTRSMSIDFFPFYYIQNNIIHITGGSTLGSTISPALSYSIVNQILYNKNPISFNFHISRIHNKILYLVTILVIIILIYKYIKS